jgi:hypothetical protein
MAWFFRSSSHPPTRTNHALAALGGQRQGGGQLRSRVQGGLLNLDDGSGFWPVSLAVTRNTNGYPIITAGGTGYSQSR